MKRSAPIKRTAPIKPKGPRISRAVKAARKLKSEDREQRNAETAAIRAAVVARAAGRCECCGRRLLPEGAFGGGPEMDHFWGRAKVPQSVENCWLLSRFCHRMKTVNSPSRLEWVQRFQRHAQANGYADEVRRTVRELQYLQTKRRLPHGGI